MSEALPRWLISRLRNAHVGRMAIIVGGGPSAPSDLKKIPHMGQAVIISANHHAFKLKLKPDYIWCKDHRRVFPGWHSRGAPVEYMETLLRPYGVPIAGPNFWCDYRAVEWQLTGYNSGQQAMAFATLLGCAPIVAIGMDCFTGATYFHDKDAPNISKGRKPGYWNSRLQRLKMALPGAPIRGCSGLVAEIFGAYNPEKHPAPGRLPEVLQRYVNMPTLWVEARRDFQDHRDRFAIIPKGYVMATNKAEADKLIRLGMVERVQMFHA